MDQEIVNFCLFTSFIYMTDMLNLGTRDIIECKQYIFKAFFKLINGTFNLKVNKVTEKENLNFDTYFIN